MWRGRRGIQTVGLSRGRAGSRGSRPPAPDQPQVTLAIGEDAHHVGARLIFSFKRSSIWDAYGLARQAIEAQRLVDIVFDPAGEL